jgi:hypothetical protein
MKLKYKCNICEKVCENNQGLTTHIRNHNITTKEYFDKFYKNSGEGICKTCGKSTEFLGLNKRYRNFCSNECNLIFSCKDRHKKCFEKILNLCELNNVIFKTKDKDNYVIQCKKCNKEFSISRKCFLNRINKSEEICIYCNPYTLPDISKGNFYQIQKYGKLYCQTEEFKEKRNETVLMNIKNNYENETFKIISKEECVLRCYCNICSSNFLIKQKDLKKRIKYNEIVCTICNKKSNFAYKEKEIVNYIKSIYKDTVVENSRKIIDTNKEIDIYLPKLKLAIEFDGLFWHNVANKGKNYHLNKSNECYKKGINLIHIFEDEWKLKQNIVKLYINKLLNLTKSVKYTNKFNFNDDSKIIKQFMQENSLFNYNGSSYLGLMNEQNDVIAAITYEIENDSLIIKDYTEKCDVVVENGLKCFVKQLKEKFNTIIFYADRRWYNDLSKFEYVKYDIVEPIKEYFYFNERTVFENIKDKIITEEYNTIYNCGYYKLYF